MLTALHIPATLAGFCLQILCFVALVTGSSAIAHIGEKHGSDESPVVLAPGYEVLSFTAPQPGSYDLPVLGSAGNGNILTSAATETSLHKLMHGKLTVLSFIYRACDDVNGCPLATFVMNQLRQQISKDPSLTDIVQLISLSFDPVRDTPESMREYRDSFGESSVAWEFATTRSREELRPILHSYGQSLSGDNDAHGESTDSALNDPQADSTISHILRVYVIDDALQIRNIFSSSLLHADTLISDLRTLAMEIQDSKDAVQTNNSPTSPTTSTVANDKTSGMFNDMARDQRAGYSTGQYVSQEQALGQSGTAINLLEHATVTTLGLPTLPHVDSLTHSSIELGRRLFYDRRLSINNTFSCAMCHIPQQGFTVNEISTAVGVEGRTVKRNAPTLLNSGYLDTLFHDARETRLEQQIWSPLLAHNEMANPSVGYVLDKIATIDGYSEAFDDAFGSPQPTMETLGKALAHYQRSLVAGDSNFDRWYFGGNQHSVSPQAKEGFTLFTGKAACSSCHTIADDFALFTDQQLHNTGIGYRRSMAKKGQPHPVTLAPGVVVMVDPAVYSDAAEKPANDLGRYEVTQVPDDRWKFRTPSLRNIALTAPYMHDGSLATLDDVIEFYDTGGIENELLSPLIVPLMLTATEKNALKAFLLALTSNQLPALINDALAAPRGDTTAGKLKN